MNDFFDFNYKRYNEIEMILNLIEGKYDLTIVDSLNNRNYSRYYIN